MVFCVEVVCTVHFLSGVVHQTQVRQVCPFPNSKQGDCVLVCDHLTRMSKTFPRQKKFKNDFSIQLPLLPQLPPRNLRQLLALQSPKAKMPRVRRAPLPQRLFLAEENDHLCLPLPLLQPHRNLLPPLPPGRPLPPCRPCHLP